MTCLLWTAWMIEWIIRVMMRHVAMRQQVCDHWKFHNIDVLLSVLRSALDQLKFVIKKHCKSKYKGNPYFCKEEIINKFSQNWTCRIVLWRSHWPRHLKTWTVLARSNTWIVGSNPTWDMNICVCTVLCAGSGLATGWSPVQGVLQTVYRITNLKKRPRSDKGL
jgi:hypothetical protein